jgi:hypothetical protein
MVAESVDLDDQAAVPPEEVDLVGADAGIELRLGQAMAEAQAPEEALEFASG